MIQTGNTISDKEIEHYLKIVNAKLLNKYTAVRTENDWRLIVNGNECVSHSVTKNELYEIIFTIAQLLDYEI